MKKQKLYMIIYKEEKRKFNQEIKINSQKANIRNKKFLGGYFSAFPPSIISVLKISSIISVLKNIQYHFSIKNILKNSI